MSACVIFVFLLLPLKLTSSFFDDLSKETKDYRMTKGIKALLNVTFSRLPTHIPNLLAHLDKQ